MELVLLATKLRIPPQPHRALQRARLIETLEQAVPLHHLILLSAPAGYGKTTLLTQWAHASQFPVAWLSISEADNDLERFFRYLLAAWEEAQPGIMESRLGLLLSAISPDAESVLATFLNVAADLPEHLVFVLDDYHLIEDASIHQALAFLLDHLPPTLHFVLAGREAPPLPLARYRARQQLLEMRADDLRFQNSETADFLNELLRLDLPLDNLTRLQHQLEGWIAGLQLFALAAQRRLAPDSPLTITGRHRFIADFLSKDVLAPLPEDLQAFLLQTSVAENLCGALCDAITGRSDSQATLETLERANLFLIPLDERREWFRYHRLFAKFLRSELEQRHPDQIAASHRRAARWYLEQALPEPAFDHAVASDAPDLVVEVFERYLTAKLNGGELRLVNRWLNAIPAEWYAPYPVLSLARVGFLAFTGAIETSLHELDDVEQRLVNTKTEASEWQLTRVVVVRCMLACMQNNLAQAEAFAERALNALPDKDLNWRPGVYAALGDTYRRNGRWEEAKACYLQALSVTASPQLRFMSAHIFGALADLALRQGRLREAGDCWEKALAVIHEQRTWGHLPLPVIGWVFIRLGELQYERNDLDHAAGHLAQGLERAELGGDLRALIAGYLVAGRLALTNGDVEAATAYLERARPYVRDAEFPHWTGRFERFQVEIWLAQENLRAAARWADETLSRDFPGSSVEADDTWLAAARVLIARGDARSIDRAQNLLERLAHAATDAGRMGVQLEALALLALAAWKRGEQTEAMTVLARALRLAEPEGFVRLFADLGFSMARLLQEARARQIMPEYVAALLSAFDADVAQDSTATAALPEPLTPREQEILALLAAGLTNREIAERLVVSPETVKKHTSTIYGKLGVSNRTSAAARARDLGLLD